MLKEPAAQFISLQSRSMRRQRTSKEYEVYRAALAMLTIILKRATSSNVWTLR